MNTRFNRMIGLLSWKSTPLLALASVCVRHCTQANAGDNCYFERVLQWDKQGNYDQALANYNQAICI
jgi:hypothetical protein